MRAIIRRERIDAGDIPQQRRGVLQRVAQGEIDAVDAAVDRPLLGDRRDRRIHHRQVGIEIAEAARLRRRHAALLQPPDVLGAVAVAARIRRRLGADQAAADIGVEGRRRDRELGGGLAGGEWPDLEAVKQGDRAMNMILTKSQIGLDGVPAAETVLSHVDGERGELIIAGE
ncbi:hypothetical protein chiPu_0031489, partial [Chiloscyllium punctatum]|nr:hypothetical protein [Chiloscyllium punctatum]